MKIFKSCLFLIMGMGLCFTISAANQTNELSPIHSDCSLPFRVKLKKADFQLPIGVQSYVHGVDHDKWLLVTGRIDGMHGFNNNNSPENFPIRLQSKILFVIDPIAKKTYTRSLEDPESGLTEEQIDLLSVTAAQAYQSGKTLYITGGYGVDSATEEMNTKNALTAIDVPGLIHWVVNPYPGETAAEHIRHIFDDIFKVTGGYMNQIGDHPTLLVMGQKFDGFYFHSGAVQEYTNQVRRFHIHDDGVNLSFSPDSPLPTIPDPNYRRRDLNVVSVVKKGKNKLIKEFLVLSGVFTPTTGVWTVPVEITADGVPSMADPSLPSTFKQAMNHYDCATFGMFSEKTGDMYTILLGGISYGFIEKTACCYEFRTDDEIPFINQTTTIRTDRHGEHTQYFMENGGYPVTLSKTVNPGNPLLFGAEAEAILLDNVPKYKNEVIKLDRIDKPTLVGYVVGGIKSTVPNTSSQADSGPSRCLFKVIIEPKKTKKKKRCCSVPN